MMQKKALGMAEEDLLRRYGFVARIPPRCLAQGWAVVFDKGEELCTLGEEMGSMLILLEGQVAIRSLSRSGKPALLDVAAAPALVGDIELFTGAVACQSVVAKTAAVCLQLPMVPCRSWLLEHPPFLAYLCATMAEKLREVSIQHSGEMLYPLQIRLASYLFHRSQKEGRRLSLRQNDVAAYFGVTARHLRRVLTEFEEKGYLRREGRSVYILQEERLWELCSQS